MDEHLKFWNSTRIELLQMYKTSILKEKKVTFVYFVVIRLSSAEV